MKLSDENGNEYELIGKAQNHEYSGYYIVNPITPKPKKIDMSACIESGIDMLFWNNNAEEKRIGKLARMPVTSANGDCYFIIDNDLEWEYIHCRPRFNHIHASPTGYKEMPIPEGFIVESWDGDDYLGERDCEEYNWKDVVMFKITGVQEGYEL